MIKTQKMLAKLAIDIFVGFIYALFIFIVLPEFAFWGRFIAAAIVFFVLSTSGSIFTKFVWGVLEKNVFVVKDTRLLIKFIDRLRFSYTVEDLIESIQDVLEFDADSSVLYINRENNYVIYNSPTKIVTEKATLEALGHNFHKRWSDGYYLFDEKLGLVSKFREARGFFIVYEQLHFYVFCRYVKVFEPSIFETLFYEFGNFQKRAETVGELTAISELSKEWDMVAETQESFLPLKLPEISKMELAAFYRPLVNVSGDLYDVLPLDEHKTFFVVGDVSGKGLASALIMGVIMNTIKILDNKEDLPAVMYEVDKAIKAMRLDDKYAVLFIGIADTKEMKIRYVNASMADPLILSRESDGYQIKPLPSNCSLIGIIDLDDIEAAEMPLNKGDVILMASDGISEVMDENGVELGDTDLYLNTVKNSAHKSAQKIVNDITDLIFDYSDNTRIRDDIALLIAKIEE